MLLKNLDTPTQIGNVLSIVSHRSSYHRSSPLLYVMTDLRDRVPANGLLAWDSEALVSIEPLSHQINEFLKSLDPRKDFRNMTCIFVNGACQTLDATISLGNKIIDRAFETLYLGFVQR